ncbi:ABC transporter ATP-binding protein [Actinokineospora bangkokensis]|uniref:ABC transporter ATP-binding protein n=1 Tax=Actinokineospora bangkokensis TaxID=1193682 RepID=A0A1Q9LS26_9PSEU|nr:ABC transporter ATP-binding protein [Actinokineospora bangkokensis]OLR94835.1 ABC transporter ATP-binding protein [Actinokineospora bangkokensis]
MTATGTTTSGVPTAPPLVEVEGLRVVDAAGRTVLAGVDLVLRAGERVGVVGESGAGKTTLALAAIGAVRPGLTVTGGRVLVDGHDVLTAPTARLRALRRGAVAYLPQDPPSALTPTLRVARQLREQAADRDPAAIAERLAQVGLPGHRAFQRRYPHQLSGGQQQRLALARATSADPRALVLDEPTAGLDGPMRALVLDQLDALVARRGLAVLFITHDLDAAARTTDRLVILRGGRVVEDGPTADVLTRPRAAYTAELVAAAPSPVVDPARVITPARGAPVLRVEGVRATRGRAVVLDGVDLDVHPGESVALLGRSGCGKTTLAQCATGALVPRTGRVLLDGRELPAALRARSVPQRRAVQLIPQDVTGSLNPRRTVGSAIAGFVKLGREAARAGERTLELLAMVGLPPEIAGRLPREVSGGQRQRVAIARALAADARVLVCDEITSSLDVRIAADVLDLLDRLRAELGFAVLTITHDLGVIARHADRVVVLDGGRVVEHGPVPAVFTDPAHPATRELLAAARAARTPGSAATAP